MPRQLQPTALVDVEWQETSGVDHPANEAEGWVVMKARKPTVGNSLEELLKAESNLRLDMLADAIEGLTDNDLAGCPAKVSAAISTLGDWLDSEGFNDDEADDEEVKAGTQDSKTNKAKRKPPAAEEAAEGELEKAKKQAPQYPDPDGMTAGTEPAAMRKGLIDRIAEAVAKRLKKPDTEPDEDVQARKMAAVESAFPTFLDEVEKAMGLDDGEIPAAITKAVGVLRDAAASAT